MPCNSNGPLKTSGMILPTGCFLSGEWYLSVACVVAVNHCQCGRWISSFRYFLPRTFILSLIAYAATLPFRSFLYDYNVFSTFILQA
jgi:hypothetical protein